MLGVEVSVMTLEEFQTYLKRPATMEEAGEIVDILGSTILSAVKMLPNTEENKEVSPWGSAWPSTAALNPSCLQRNFSATCRR